MEYLPVSVDKSHLTTIGERLYSESIELIRGLINNAYDADATEVDITMTDEFIEIRDNGAGMDREGLKQSFNIGSPEKGFSYEKNKMFNYRLRRPEVLSLVPLIPLQKLPVRFSPKRLEKNPHILWLFFLTFNSVFRIFNSSKCEFLSKSNKEVIRVCKGDTSMKKADLQVRLYIRSQRT